MRVGGVVENRRWSAKQPVMVSKALKKEEEKEEEVEEKVASKETSSFADHQRDLIKCYSIGQEKQLNVTRFIWRLLVKSAKDTLTLISLPSTSFYSIILNLCCSDLLQFVYRSNISPFSLSLSLSLSLFLSLSLSLSLYIYVYIYKDACTCACACVPPHTHTHTHTSRDILHYWLKTKLQIWQHR